MLPDVMYMKFDFNERLIIRYERDGECNQCAMCCKYVIRFKSEHNSVHKPNPISGWHVGNGEFQLYYGGVTNGVCVNGHWRYFRDIEVTDELTPCGRLTVDNKCSIHQGKHLLSRVWPMSPEQASAFKECSYTFREVQRWTMDEWWGEGWETARVEQAIEVTA